jgi:hypothetical protein
MLTFFTLFSCAPARSELRVITENSNQLDCVSDFNVA